MNLVSIILITYNRSKLLQECIQSILKQKYGHFELLIVDDGSEDDTKDRVLEIKDHRIKYFHFPHCGFIGRLKNFALSQATGSYIAFMDSDDMWKEDKLQKQMELFAANPSVDFSVTDVTEFKGEVILKPHTYRIQNTIQFENIFDRMKMNAFLVFTPTLVMKRECIDKVGYFDESMRCGSFHFHMRLAYYYSCGIIYEPLVLRRFHDSNISDEIPLEFYHEYLDTFQYLYQKGMIQKKVLRRSQGMAYLKMGKLYEGSGYTKKAISNYFDSFMANLFYPRQVFHFAKLFLKVKPQKLP